MRTWLNFKRRPKGLIIMLLMVILVSGGIVGRAFAGTGSVDFTAGDVPTNYGKIVTKTVNGIDYQMFPVDTAGDLDYTDSAFDMVCHGADWGYNVFVGPDDGANGGYYGILFKSKNGELFSLNSLNVYDYGWGGNTFHLQARLNGSDVGTTHDFTGNTNNNYAAVNVSSNTDFDNIDSFIVYYSGISWLGINNVSITTPSSYTVTYNGNGHTSGTAPVDGSSPYVENTSVTVLNNSNLTKTGFTFAGWNTASNNGGTAYAPTNNFTISGNTTLYATWDLASAGVSIAAPAAGGTPNNAAAVETATGNANYTVSNITWNEALTAGNKFKANQVYTAAVTLTSKNGYKFTSAAFTPTVASASSVGTTVTTGTAIGNTVTFTATFNSTAALSVSSIAVKTQPTKLSYIEGDSLDLTGLEATLTHNDGTTLDVTLSNFAANGISLSVANGTTLTVASHHGHTIDLTCNGHTVSSNALAVSAPTGAATVNMSAPVAGAAPQLAAAVETATSDSVFTVTNVIWNEALTPGGKFKAGEIYTATVTLTAKANKKFQSPAFTPTVANAASVGTTVTTGTGLGNTVTFTASFASTAPQSVSSIAINTQPSNLGYIEGDSLSLTGLGATLTYNDGTTLNVSLANFGANGISVSLANGTVLDVATHHGQVITLTCNGQNTTTNALSVSAPTGSASITMTAPVAGASPQNAAAIETATSGSDFTVTQVTWNEALTPASKFKAAETYTATITLTAKANKKFQPGPFTPTVASAASVGTTTTVGTTTGNTVSFTVTFAATAVQSVSAISVQTQPSVLGYIEGDALSLSGLAATLTYNDGTSLNVALANFAANNITLSLANGAILDVATHHGQPITLTCNGHTGDTSVLSVSLPTSAATVIMTAPASGGTPQNAGAIETATSHSDFTVTQVVWNESLTAASKFKAAQVYTATVTLTAKANKRFQSAAFTPVVASASSVGTTTTTGTSKGNSVSFTVTFSATSAKVVTGIVVKTQPTLNYTEGQNLSLSAMVASYIHNDGSTLDVAFSNFAANSITVSLADQTPLSIATHHGHVITLTYNAMTADTNALQITVNNDSDEEAPTPLPVTVPTQKTGVEVLVNGRVEIAAQSETKTLNNVTTQTVTVNPAIIDQKLALEGNNTVITIPISSKADVAIGQLNGQTVKNMETKDAVLEIKTESVTYSLPASEINIDSISTSIGSQVQLKDINIQIQIAATPDERAQIVQNTANQSQYQMVIRPVDFEITCTSGTKTVDVTKFNGYVERTVAIPSGVDPSKITTGIVLNSDGSFSHVPTTVVAINGNYYAKINSLTNSTYSIIWSPKDLPDMNAHWAKNQATNMVSRLIMETDSTGIFSPEDKMTRAEFTSAVIKALGLNRTNVGQVVYKDVLADSPYFDEIYIASQYGLISGIGSNAFNPNGEISRQEAMVILSKSFSLVKLNAVNDSEDIAKWISSFGDQGDIANWAKSSVASCLGTQVATGRTNGNFDPRASITKAEVASLLNKLLSLAKLI